MFSFEVIILGASGGPDGGATQCFVVRPEGRRDLQSVCVDAGAGAGQISHMIARYGTYSNSKMIESFYANDMEPSEKYFDPRAVVEFGFPKFITSHLAHKEPGFNTRMKTLEIYSGIKEYYITHAHLDHVSAMILNSPLAYEGEECSGDTKKIWGLTFTVEAIKNHLFNDVIWPDLAGCNEKRFQFGTLNNKESHQCDTFPGWDIIPLKVNHGFTARNTQKRIYSTLYLFHDRESNDSLLICGDLECNLSSDATKGLLEKALRHVVDNVPQGKLKGIIIECSSATSVRESQLYGHLSPVHLIELLSRLRDMYQDTNALKGLDIVITHVKRVTAVRDPRLTILDELRHLAKKTGLTGVKFSMAIQGHTFRF